MASQTKLHAVAPKTNETLVSRLEGLLSDARAGELVGLAYISQWAGDQVASDWCLSELNARRLVGEIEFLKRDLLESVE